MRLKRLTRRSQLIKITSKDGLTQVLAFQLLNLPLPMTQLQSNGKINRNRYVTIPLVKTTYGSSPWMNIKWNLGPMKENGNRLVTLPTVTKYKIELLAIRQ